MSKSKPRRKYVTTFYAVGRADTKAALKSLPLMFTVKEALQVARELTKETGVKFVALACRLYSNGDVER